MQQKKDSSVGSGAQARDIVELTWQDKYVSLQMENQKLKRRIREIGATLHEWRGRALQYQTDKEDCQEMARERET
jgi:hypothetical protein